MSFWRSLNTGLYRGWYRLRNRARASRLSGDEPAGGRSTDVLCLAWGRIGDTVLTTGILKHFKKAFDGSRILYAGRPEVAELVVPFVDEFIPLGDPRLERRYACVFTDIHFFYGGTAALGATLDGLSAQRKFVYEGYHLGPGLVPHRTYPATAEVVPGTKATHLLDHNAHYFAEVTRRLTGNAYPAADVKPVVKVSSDPHILERFELEEGGYVAWQPSSNNRKKDYPRAKWREVIAAFPHTWFVALGSEGPPIGAHNVLDLRGRTTLREAMTLIAGAQAFLGPDSGLTHIATALERPTVCVAQNANLGYFFPYPGYPNLTTVDNEAYRSCSGCFMTCSREPILFTWLRGAKCVRELPPASVIDALRSRLAATLVTG